MMRGLSAADILWAWECGRHRHPIDRALLMLRAADNALPVTELDRLSIGQRDARLLELRIATFGDRLDGRADCPNCGAALEFSLPAGDLRIAPNDAVDGGIVLEEAGRQLRLRPPNSRDLAWLVQGGQTGDPARALLQRCLEDEETTDGDADLETLPPRLLQRIPDLLAEIDPQADVSLDLTCAACGHGWSLPFDIASFLWAELAAQARRLLAEVDALARRYGWGEADILALSAARRQLYLEMAS